MPDYHDTIPYDPLGNDRPTEPMPPLRPEDMTIRLPGGGTPPPPTTPTAQPPRDPRRRNVILIVAAVLVVVLVAGGIIALSGRHGATGCASCADSVATATLTPTHAATTTLATVAPTNATTQQTPVTTTCAGIAAFAQASAATTGSTNFLAVPFLPNTVAQPPVDSESNGFQSRSLPLCTPGITSATTLQTTFGADLTTKGWRPAATGSSQGCGNTACWSQTDPSTSPATTQSINLSAVTISGSVATYTIHLTIAPLFTGTGAPLPSNTTFSFEHSTRAELQWDTKLHTITNNNVVGALLPANSYATTTYATLSQTISSFGPLPDIPKIAGQAGALQGTGGFYIRFIIQGVSASQITLTYIVYPYGF